MSICPVPNEFSNVEATQACKYIIKFLKIINYILLTINV